MNSYDDFAKPLFDDVRRALNRIKMRTLMLSNDKYELHRDSSFRIIRRPDGRTGHGFWTYAVHACEEFDQNKPPSVMLDKFEDWGCPYCHAKPSPQFIDLCLLSDAS